MAQNEELGISETENLQIEALKAGATEEEASLHGKLGTIRRVPVETEERQGTQGRTRLSGERHNGMPIHDIVTRPVKGVSLLDAVRTSQPALSNDTLKEKAMEIALIKQSMDSQLDATHSYSQSLDELRNSASPRETLELYQSEFGKFRQKEMASLIVDDANNGTISAQAAAEALDESTKSLEAYQGDKGTERVIADAYYNRDLSDVIKEEAIAKNYAYKKVQQLSEEQSGFKTFTNAIGLLVPDFIKDANDLVDGKLFGTKTDLIRMVNTYQNLPSAKKPDAFDEIWERVNEAYDGNTFKLAGFVNLLHSTDPETEFYIGATFDAIDILGSATLGWAVRTAKNVASGNKVAHKLSELGAKEDAAKMVETASIPSVDNPADVIAGSKLDAAITASPYKWEQMLMGIDSKDGLALNIRNVKDEKLRAIGQEIEQEVQKPFSEIRDRDFLLKFNPLTPEERQQQISKFGKEKAALAEERGVFYEEVGPIFDNERGFVFEYSWDGGKVKEKVRWNVNHEGIFEGLNERIKDIGQNFSWFLSPELKINSFAGIVDDITQGGQQVARVKRELTSIGRALNDGMRRSERIAVDELLIAGDEYPGTKVFGYHELKDLGVETTSGYRTYSDKEIKNYYKKVAFNQELWAIKNHQIKSELEFAGAKTVSYVNPKTDASEEIIGEIKDSWRGVEVPDDAMMFAPQLRDGGFISKRAARDMSDKDADFVPVKLVTPKIVGDKKVEWALFKNEGKAGRASFRELPDEVLHRMPGYVARNYKPGYYYIKDNISGKTIRAFDSKVEADKWRKEQQVLYDQMEPEVLQKEGFGSRIVLQTFRDREFTKTEQLIEEANRYGGLITGARKKENLLLNAEGRRLERAGWGEATQRYINSVSETMPLNEYRMALKKRWINTVNHYAKIDNQDFGINPREDWRTAEINISEPGLKKSLEDMREYMLQQFRVWSDEERWFNKKMMSLAESMSPKSKFFENKAIAIAHSNPLDNWVAASFHAFLGWFNPRNLYIQAQNSQLAISMHPILGLKASQEAMVMQTLVNLPTDHAVAMAKKLGKIPGMSTDGLIEDIRTFKRSGMDASILRVADNESAVTGFAPGTYNRFKNLAKKGTVFYEQGELFSRLVAWNISKAKWKKANPGKRMTDDDIKKTVKETFRIHMNMQRENAATWQRGMLRPMTQFLQVQAKLYEKMLPGLFFRNIEGGWTPREAYSVLAGQLVMYGTLGVPIAEEVSSWLGDQTGLTPGEIQAQYPKLAELAADGMMGVLFESMGFENQFGGDTASLLAAADDNVITGFWEAGSRLITQGYDGDTFGEIAFGPSLNIVRRGGDAIINAMDSIRVIAAHPTPEQVGAAALKFADDFAAITSTWNNARKARWLHYNGHLYSRSGRIILDEVDTQNINFRTIMARAMGMPLDIEASYYSLAKQNRDRSADRAGIKKDLKRVTHQYFLDNNQERFMVMKALLLNGLDPSEQADIKQEVFKEFMRTHGQSDLDRENKRYINQMIRSGGKHPSNLSVLNILEQKQKESNGEQ